MALALFDMTRGAITFADLLDMDVDEAADWLEDAQAYRCEINKAVARGRR